MVLFKNQNGCHVLKKSLAILGPFDFRKPVNESAITLLQKIYNITQDSNDIFCSISNNNYGVIIMKQVVQILNSTKTQGAKVSKQSA